MISLGRFFAILVCASAMAFALHPHRSAWAENLGMLLRLGDQASTSIQPAGDTDDFVFDGLVGTTVTISVARTNKLVRFGLPETGRYLIRVGSASEGAYALKTKGKPPRTIKDKGRALGQEETHDYVVGGDTGAMLKATFKWKGGNGFEVLAVLDPEGNEIEGAPGAFVPKGSKKKATILLSGGFGEYTIRIGNAPSTTVITAKLRVKFPKAKRAKLDFTADEPRVTGVAPTSGNPGTQVTVKGVNFHQEAGALCDGEPASTIYVSATELTTVAPLGDGPVDIHVRNPDGQENGLEDAFTIVPAVPGITSVSPTSGPVSGGTLVDVFGANLSAITKVTLGGQDLTRSPTIVSDGHLTFVTDPYVALTVDLTLTDMFNQTVTKTNAFTFHRTYEDVTTSRMSGNTGGVFMGGEALALGDVDGDTHPDLLIVNDMRGYYVYYYGYDTNSGYRLYPIRLFLNDGNGNFKTEKSLPAASGNEGWQASAAAFGHLDDNDTLDLVLTTRFPLYSLYIEKPSDPGEYYVKLYSSTRVLLNDGNGNFTHSPSAMPDPMAQDGIDVLNGTSLLLGDVDDDGDTDILVADRYMARTSYYTDYDYPYTYRDYYVPATRVLVNDGTAKFTNVSSVVLPDVLDGDLFAADALAIGDLDRDGETDIVLTSAYYSYVTGSRTRILIATPTGGFDNRTATMMPATTPDDDWGGECMAIGDVDGDEWPDLVVGDDYYRYSGGQFTSSTRIFTGGPSGFTNRTASLMPPVSQSYYGEHWLAEDLSLGDFDGDGDPDLLLTDDYYILADVGGVRIPSTRLLRNDGTGKFTNTTADELPVSRDTGDFYEGEDLLVGDLDNDGDLDVLVSASVYSFYYSYAYDYGSTHPIQQFEQK
ncbi:MAG: FG-GAP-like repeat-containing protein [Planctomycetota bacterium]|jgi:hypothetical protein